MLPVLSLTGFSVEEKVRQMEMYLHQLREQLEFELADISVENMSPALQNSLSKMGVSMEEAKKAAEESTERASMTANKMLTVSDVINSEQYKASQEALIENNIVSESGSLRLAGGTQICYGTTEDLGIVFAYPFVEAPVLVITPEVSVELTLEGFTRTETGSIQWIAIGKYEEGTENVNE